MTHLPVLEAFIILSTLQWNIAATALFPNQNNTNLAFTSKISTSASSSSSPCVGRTSNLSPANVINKNSLDDVCKTSVSFPIGAEQSNGHVTFDSQNYINCSVSYPVSPSKSDYTLTFWVFNNCSSTSSCTVTLSNSNNLVQLKSGRLYISGNSVGSSFGSEWTFVTLRRNTQISTIFIGDMQYETSQLPSTLSKIEIDPSSISSGEYFRLADIRLYTGFLTDREINKIHTKSSKLTEELPFSECRCPETHPKIHKDDSPYSLKCENPSSTVTNRFKDGSVVENVVDGDDATKWVTTSTNIDLKIQLDATYQIDEIEVKMTRISSCTTTITLDSGKNKVWTSGEVRWTDISSSISMRSELDKVVSRNITISFRGFCNQNNHEIKDVLIRGRCNCYGNANSCTYRSGGYSCQCLSGTKTKGDNCGQCQTNYYREADDFGCEHNCGCDSSGTQSSASTCNEVGGQCTCKTNVQGRTCDTCKHLCYDLQSSNSNGCTRSTCDSKGTIKCNDNSTCYQCMCKPNVIGVNCDKCKLNHYGFDTSTNGCVPCLCNVSGTMNRNESCNLLTGKCNCKFHVTGRQCDKCMTGFFGFDAYLTVGCQPCLCNKYGSSDNDCNMLTGQCPCVGDNLNRQCNPDIEDMSPKFGPLAGGTRVTLTGQLLGSSGNGRSFSVFKDDSGSSANSPYNVTSWNQTHIEFETRSSASPVTTNFNMRWSLPYYTDTTQDETKFETFQFRADPVVTKYSPLTSFKSGGCNIRFEGSYLDSVARPRLMSYLKGSITKVTQCTAKGSNVLICESPDLTSNSDTNYTYGLSLDGITKYTDLSSHFDAVVMVTDNPTVMKKTYDDYRMLFDDTITIQGSRLKEGCHDNLRVSIGDVNCVIQSAVNTQIICKPDLDFPGVNQPYREINVTIGNFWSSAGGMKIIVFWSTVEFLGIAIGAGVFILLIFVIVICCCVRRRKKKNGSNRDSKSSQNGFDLPIVTSSKATLIEKEEVPRYTNRLYPEKKNLYDALSHDDTDCSEDFLHKLESSVREKIKKTVSDRKLIQPDKICTLKGTEIRIINGTFSKGSPNAGKELTIKMNVRLLKELLDDGKYPTWINNGLLECMKFQDCFHDNILRIMGLTVDQNRFYVLYPKFTRGLKEYLNDTTQNFDVKYLLEICMQVAQGMSFMSDENMVHKDLATRNCVVMPDNAIKISDSSFSWNLYAKEYMYDSQREKYLPVRWMALESLKMGFYDISSDVWSFGILLWEVMSRSLYLPYHEELNDEKIKDHVDQGYQLGQPQDTPEELYTLMVNCWEVENQYRPSFKEVISRLDDIMNPESLYVNLDTSVSGKNYPAPPPPQRGSRRY